MWLVWNDFEGGLLFSSKEEAEAFRSKQFLPEGFSISFFTL